MTDHPPDFFEGTEMPTAGWWEALWPAPASVIAAVGIGPGMQVVDLCSGDGWFTLAVAKVARHVVAIDIDPQLLVVARHRVVEAGATNCDFVTGDAYRLQDLVQGEVDFVFMANAFHGVPDRLRLASVVRNALKPGGRFAIVNWHPRPREQTTVLGEPRGPRTDLRLSAQQTIESVIAADFKSVAVVAIPPYHYGAIFERIIGEDTGFAAGKTSSHIQTGDWSRPKRPTRGRTPASVLMLVSSGQADTRN